MNGLLWSGSGKDLFIATQKNPNYSGPIFEDNLWGLGNMGGDALALVANFVVCTFLLMLIELRLCDGLRNISLKSPPPPIE